LISYDIGVSEADPVVFHAFREVGYLVLNPTELDVGYTLSFMPVITKGRDFDAGDSRSFLLIDI
jgi:hypothetical protein